MSNADPRFTYGAFSPQTYFAASGALPPGSQPPPPPRHRPPAVAYVFAAVLPLVLLAVLAAPVGILYALGGFGPGTSVEGDVPGRGPSDAGDAGVRDPYFPDYGNSGYDVIKYDIAIDFDPRTEQITGTTKITARATATLKSFFYDFLLTTDSVHVNNQPAEFDPQDYQDVKVTPASPVASGAVFEVTVAYSGRPDAISARTADPWWVTNQEWT